MDKTSGRSNDVTKKVYKRTWHGASQTIRKLTKPIRIAKVVYRQQIRQNTQLIWKAMTPSFYF